MLIAGGGVIGLACAWRAARRGMEVRVIERSEAVAAEATGVAAGMLAPVGEASWGEEALLELGLASLRMWDGFASELESDSGIATGLSALRRAPRRARPRRGGGAAPAPRAPRAARARVGVALAERCRELEPALSPKVAGGLHAPDEAAADPRRSREALAAAVASWAARSSSGAEIVAPTSRTAARA